MPVLGRLPGSAGFVHRPPSVGTSPRLFFRSELVGACDGWSVDPLAADGLREHVFGGLVGLGDDVCVVCFSASGHWRVDACVVGGCVDEDQGCVDGSTLGGVAGLGVAQPDVGCHIVGG